MFAALRCAASHPRCWRTVGPKCNLLAASKLQDTVSHTSDPSATACPMLDMGIQPSRFPYF